MGQSVFRQILKQKSVEFARIFARRLRLPKQSSSKIAKKNLGIDRANKKKLQRFYQKSGQLILTATLRILKKY